LASAPASPPTIIQNNMPVIMLVALSVCGYNTPVYSLYVGKRFLLVRRPEGRDRTLIATREAAGEGCSAPVRDHLLLSFVLAEGRGRNFDPTAEQRHWRDLAREYAEGDPTTRRATRSEIDNLISGMASWGSRPLRHGVRQCGGSGDFLLAYNMAR